MAKKKTAKSTELGGAVRASVLNSVSFVVEAFIGDTQVSLGDLEALEEGSILPLDAGLNNTVSLRLNGVEIAQGELVSVDDNFAVRLTDVAK